MTDRSRNVFCALPDLSIRSEDRSESGCFSPLHAITLYVNPIVISICHREIGIYDIYSFRSLTYDIQFVFEHYISKRNSLIILANLSKGAVLSQNKPLPK